MKKALLSICASQTLFICIGRYKQGGSDVREMYHGKQRLKIHTVFRNANLKRRHQLADPCVDGR
jgi:hypothetical protein